MARKLYFEKELTDEWREGLEASIRVGGYVTTERERHRGTIATALWVALDFQDMGVMNPQSLQEESWLLLVERYPMARQGASGELRRSRSRRGARPDTGPRGSEDARATGARANMAAQEAGDPNQVPVR